MSNWGERLKEIREKNKMTQQNLATIVGRDVTRISRYERGKGAKKLPGSLKFDLLKVFTKKELDYIESGEEYSQYAADDLASSNASDVNDSGSVYKKTHYVEIPYYQDVYASAGGGSDRTDGSVRSPVSFSRAFLNSYLGVYNLNGISIINAAGDSMEPTIKSGELMFVSSMELEEFKDGGIYVIMCGDVLMVKRVTYDPLTGEYTLVSDNGKVAPVKLRMDEADGCRFVGRVVGHMDRV